MTQVVNSTIISIASLFVAIAALAFGAYQWDKAQSATADAKRTELLRQIGELKAISVNIYATNKSLKHQISSEPLPTHRKTASGCVPAPEWTREMKTIRAELIRGIDVITGRAKEYMTYADELYAKFHDFGMSYSDREIHESLAEVGRKIAVAKLLDKEPPRSADFGSRLKRLQSGLACT